MPIISGGKTFLRSLIWWCWKNFQILVRSHLSHLFALSLGILVLIREWDVLIPMARFQHSPNKGEVLILVLTLGTIAGALWEFFGNKLSTAPQEVRFIAAMRTLLIELEQFTYGVKNDGKSPQDRLVEFTNGFIAATCKALCGKKTVHAGFMWTPEGSSDLELSNWSRESDYPKELKIPIPKDDNDVTGPAGRAHQKLKVVYMPVKKWKLSWPLTLVVNGKERYKALNPCEGWVDAPGKVQDFRSILCLPVAVHLGNVQRQIFGVLNYSTRAFDPFVDRDFMMGECFSSVLAQATAAAQRQKDAQQIASKP